MQDQDNITQNSKENEKLNETVRENSGIENVQPINSENNLSENNINETVSAQNNQEIPSVEYIGDQPRQEIPTAENKEFQTAQVIEVENAQKVDVKTEEPFIFNDYEIKMWEFNPRIYKILTGSTIFCLLALFAVAQSNVLNTKACDSPMVSKVCQVLDTVYVGSVLLNSDKDWINEDYEKTDLGDAEITYIDTSNVSPPLPYPQGYFALANPEMVYNDPMIIPGGDFPAADGFPPATNFPPATIPNSNFPPITAPNPITAPQKLPPPPRRRSNNKLPTSGISIGGDENPIGAESPVGAENPVKGDLKEFPTAGNNDNTKKETETAKNNPNQKQPDIKSDSLEDVTLNRKPLDDLGDYVNQMIKDAKVDIKTPFVVQATGKLDKNGKIQTGTYKTIKAESSDEDMIAVVQRSIAAINDSGYLGYLKDLSGKDLTLTFTQTDENIVGAVQSEMESERRARSIESALNLLIGIMKAKKSAENADANDKDDLELLKAATVKTDGKKIIIMFDVDKKIAHPMIERKLLAPRTDKEKSNSNSAAQTENGNPKAGK